MDRGLFKPELSRLLQLYNKTGLSSMDFVPFKINFAFRKHLTLVIAFEGGLLYVRGEQMKEKRSFALSSPLSIPSRCKRNVL